jgi:hypothetical protein
VNHFLRIQAIGRFPELPIDVVRFEKLKRSRSIMSAAIALEEIYDILVSNYLRIEQLLVEMAASQMVQYRFDYIDFFDGRSRFNAAFVNLLTSARLYVDQVRSKASACAPDEMGIGSEVKALLSTEYDSSPSYRFMEALRNHVQHAGLPVGFVSYGSSRNKEEDYALLEYYMIVMAKKSLLLEDPEFKQSALEGLPENIDLLATTREYLEALSRAHNGTRQKVNASVALARQVVQEAVDEYSAAYGKKPVGLAAIRASDGRWDEKISILLDWDDVRERLHMRNPVLTNLSKRYVSSRIRPSNEK